MNTSGVVEIKDGHLYVDNIKYYKLSELRALSEGIYTDSNETSNNIFMMEPGRTLYLFLKICNKAEICTVKLTNSIIMEGNSSKLITASPDKETVYALGSPVTSKRKRSTADVQVVLPAGMEDGQSVLISELSEEEMNSTFGSDASTEFVPYIVDPLTTLDKAERHLRRR